jgi:hypothetical protein
MTNPQDPDNPQGQQPSGYDQSGYPQYEPTPTPPGSGTPYDPYAPQQPYGQPGYPAYPQPYAQARTNTMAILSLVFAFVFAPLAIVFGYMAKKQIKQTGEDGDGLATAGLVMGYIFTGLGLLACCGWVILVGITGAMNGNHGY